ncbi:MBL fold metallo-hydrolase [Roseibium sp. MMSF_3544]|uniref:MBL fold metallo-hydrolase n=1 Tax=unclassified Roseibium TaxID=2629323 RepID=UPI00273CF836|nr:MBL fold metallo-hydrolase [Roseibium sp. MMSF_3544]
MKHNREFAPHYGTPVELAPGLRRLTAQNPGPFTFHGTNTYLIGSRRLLVLDPGPALPDHIEAIAKAADGAKIEAILVSHTHMDHSPGARVLQDKTGASIIGCGPHRAARDLLDNEINPLDSSADKDHLPARQMFDGDLFDAADATVEAIETPGHTANHLCFAITGSDLILSADHVMGWSTSIVAPPDGSMRDYMASIDKMLLRPETRYFPGHGGSISDAKTYVQELKQHRLDREKAILRSISGGERSIIEIVRELYADVDPSLHRAASLSVFAHLEDLVDRKLALAMPDLALDARYRKTG